MSKLKKIALLIALLTIAAQLYVPTSMATRYENILEKGESYLFKVVPRDPADPFKGRYVRLTFPIDNGKISDLENPEKVKNLRSQSNAYVTLDKTTEGLVRILNIEKTKPSAGDFIKVKMGYHYGDEYSIKLPFNRYYAKESKAPKIEALLWNRERMQDRTFYADVRVRNGYGVIAELYVEDTPILEYLKKNQ